MLETTLSGEVISTPIYGDVEFATALLFGLLVIAFAPRVNYVSCFFGAVLRPR